ncbi:MAG: class I tRNA ligase family protein [Tepidisphaeraceae bacterium]|jgi:leucyl-tRNA synthetase
MPYNFTTIEKKWQEYWLKNKSFRALEPAEAANMPKAYVLDMFPYPSGSGLHVGHPEGYTATDIYSRYLRMKGRNVLHPIGWDAFGLPAEQYAVKTNTHPRITTETNIATFRRQIQALGLSYDWDREVDTTDPGYYKWTQWIFLRIYNSYFDPVEQKAKPIGFLMEQLVNENYVVAPDNSIHLNPAGEGMEQLAGEVRIERLWSELSDDEKREVIDGQRLAYTAEVAVNWCPSLGTVLANEEVIDGRSEVGGFPVERRPLRQWMLRITTYAERLAEDLNLLSWPESLKDMQRNWIGKSVGADVDFQIEGLDQDDEDASVTVFTTRPDTLYGATYMVLAPEHPVVDRVTTADQKAAVEAYKTACATRSERDRMAEAKDKSGVFTGAYAVNPVNDERIPIWIADYVLMGYGTGAIMAVPAHDQRDFDFATKFKLPIRQVVKPAADKAPVCSAAGAPTGGIRHGHATPKTASEGTGGTSSATCEAPIDSAFCDEGISINSDVINGLPTPEAQEKIVHFLHAQGVAKQTVKYKLRDWLFSRQRYWGEPFPVVIDEQGNAHSLRDDELPVLLPEMEDFKPTGTPEPPLSKATQWLGYEKDGKVYRRETNTMPQWAGSCWYYLRYIDPKNTERFLNPAKEKYWMPVDLYVGGAEHAVLHLLYARFWHKVLFDLGHVSTPEPFQRLINQGLILGEVEYREFLRDDSTVGADGTLTWSDLKFVPVSAEFVDDNWSRLSEAQLEQLTKKDPDVDGVESVDKRTGKSVFAKLLSAQDVIKRGDAYYSKTDPTIRVHAQAFKMSKSRGNVVNPDEILKEFGADCFRLYEMYMGPLEASKPWNTRDIVGMRRFLTSVGRTYGLDPEFSAPEIVAQPIVPPEVPTTNTSDKIDQGLYGIRQDIERKMHRTIKEVTEDIESLRFNTAIAKLIELNNKLHSEVFKDGLPRELAENFALLLAPFAPHICEEMWERLGHTGSLARHPWPAYDPAKLVESTIELPVQVNGKIRDKIVVPANADEKTVLEMAMKCERVKPWIEGKTIKTAKYVPKKLVTIAVA